MNCKYYDCTHQFIKITGNFEQSKARSGSMQEFKISLTIKYTRREVYHTETKLVIKTDSQFIPTNSELINQ